jgi:hypothetical protein
MARLRRLAPAGALALLATAAGAAGPLGVTGGRAFEEARTADETAAAALEEGERAVTRLRDLVAAGGGPPEALRGHLEEAEAARQALASYRGLAQAGATEAMQLVSEATRAAAAASPDPVRRATLEQHALLAAREASVMAARARAEAERLRAILAEARVASLGSGRVPGSRLPGGGAGTVQPALAGGEVEVPNLVGARLEAATRDLDQAGLRLGAASGPREGFVVEQQPEAGARVPRRSTVSVTLSATAATITAPPR